MKNKSIFVIGAQTEDCDLLEQVFYTNDANGYFFDSNSKDLSVIVNNYIGVFKNSFSVILFNANADGIYDLIQELLKEKWSPFVPVIAYGNSSNDLMTERIYRRVDDFIFKESGWIDMIDVSCRSWLTAQKKYLPDKTNLDRYYILDQKTESLNLKIGLN